MSFTFVHHAPLGRGVNPNDVEQVRELQTYLDFLDQVVTGGGGGYIGGRIVFPDVADPEFEIQVYRFLDENVHNEKLYLIFEINMDLKTMLTDKGPLWDRVMRQVKWHSTLGGAGECLNIYQAGNAGVFVMQSSKGMDAVVTHQTRSQIAAI